MAMSSKVVIDKNPAKFLRKLAKSTPQVFIKIDDFFEQRFAKCEKPLHSPLRNLIKSCEGLRIFRDLCGVVGNF